MTLPARPYDLVMFDLDGTLRANLPEGFEVAVAFARQSGIQLDDAQALAIEREAHRYWASGPRVGADFARFEKRDFWENYNCVLLEAVGVDPALARAAAPAMQDLYDHHFDPQDVVFADSFVVLRALRVAGYKTGLASNREGELDTYCSSVQLRPLLDFTLSGGQAGGYKPEPVLFEKALALAGCSASRTLYVGDNYFADVIGAQRAGIDALLIDPRNAFAQMYDKRIRHLRDLLPWLNLS